MDCTIYVGKTKGPICCTESTCSSELSFQLSFRPAGRLQEIIIELKNYSNLIEVNGFSRRCRIEPQIRY